MNMEINEFKSLVLPVKEKIYSLAMILLKSKEESNDALQEVFLRLWENRHKLSEVINMEAYAIRITKNLCLDKLKAAKKTRPIDKHEYYLEYQEANPYKRLEIDDSATQMQNILNKLPEQQRLVIFLRDVKGYSFEEMEEMTGLGLNVLRVTLSRARKSARVLYLKLNDYEIN